MTTSIRIFAVFLAAALLSGCGKYVKPINESYASPREIPPGPGLFTGDDGEVTFHLGQ